MEKYIIQGGNKLDGELKVYSAKNAVLALLAATILTDQPVTIRQCPFISDVFNMLEILKKLGCKVMWQDDSVTIDAQTANCCEIPQEIAKEIRSSIFLMGSILGRFKKAKAVFPGGCDIGLRPIDLHLKGLRALAVDIKEEGGYIFCDGENMTGSNVHLDFPSVGATENIMLASVLTKGKTVISNVAREPEIVCLQALLNSMGADVLGAGTSVIEIVGVQKLHGAEITPIPDRIVAGTYIIATCITGGKLKLTNCNPTHLTALINKLSGVSCDILIDGNQVYVKGYAQPRSINIVETAPHPGFPTDLQAQMMALQCVSEGASVIVENVFETRYKQVGELIKMGANITVKDRIAIVRGVKTLYGARVSANDLRGGAALVLAGLAAKGETIISDIKHIERGYFNLDEQLKSVGAKIDKM